MNRGERLFVTGALVTGLTLSVGACDNTPPVRGGISVDCNDPNDPLAQLYIDTKVTANTFYIGVGDRQLKVDFTTNQLTPDDNDESSLQVAPEDPALPPKFPTVIFEGKQGKPETYITVLNKSGVITQPFCLNGNKLVKSRSFLGIPRSS